ncbi:MAG: hypothetical protein BGO14_00660 [Chlamydiales bacterium 38-26]|nr:fibronectin type III domain-containing protein [Chlamydiales bacterium]OJV07234.1 MAG: hypothetical protein BGO14_00660 [Chlamydiales bacterium 38-26]
MLKLLLSCLLLFAPLHPLLAIEKTCSFNQTTQETLALEELEGPKEIQFTKWTLKNTGDKIVKNLFVTVNSSREQRAQTLKNDLQSKDLWECWNKYHLEARESLIYAPLSADYISVPTRQVPSKCKSLREYYLHGKWHLINHIDNVVYVGLDNHSIVGYEEIADDPLLALRTKIMQKNDVHSIEQPHFHFATFDIFPEDFEGEDPEEKVLIHPIQEGYTLYPGESLTFYAEKRMEQTFDIKERFSDSKSFQFLPREYLNHVSNHTDGTIYVHYNKELRPLEIAPNQIQTFVMGVPFQSCLIEAPDSTQGTIVCGANCKSLETFNPGLNEIYLNADSNASLLDFKLDYEIYEFKYPFHIVNPSQTFDYVSPVFELEAMYQFTTPPIIQWQISDKKDFSHLIPNLSQTEEYKSKISLSVTDQSFLNPGQTYYFRVRPLGARWSPIFEFTINKPASVDPSFKILGEGQYEISWTAHPDSDVTYYVFASNHFDFIPSMYSEEIHCLFEERSGVPFCIPIVLQKTKENSIQIGTDYAFYRVVVEKDGQYSTPSSLIRVYDYGLSIPRDVLQTVTDAEGNHHVERVAFPPAYPHLEELMSASSAKLHFHSDYYAYNPHVDANVWNNMVPYFLPENHPVKPKLDRLFRKRVTQNKQTLKKAGFTEPEPKRFSKTIVSKNKKIPGYIFKFFHDEQKDIQDARNCLRRVTGAISVQEALNRYNINHLFVVPKKYIYPLPAHPSPTETSYRKNFVVVENELDIYTGKENNKMWKSPVINPITLTWTFWLLQELGLNDSPYSFNMPITRDGRIAFVDTEHHHKWPVPFEKLWPFLTPEMGSFWKNLCQQHGF